MYYESNALTDVSRVFLSPSIQNTNGGDSTKESASLRYSLRWDVKQRGYVVTDVSVQLIGPVFKDQALQESMLPRYTKYVFFGGGVLPHARPAHGIMGPLRTPFTYNVNYMDQTNCETHSILWGEIAQTLQDVLQGS